MTASLILGTGLLAVSLFAAMLGGLLVLSVREIRQLVARVEADGWRIAELKSALATRAPLLDPRQPLAPTTVRRAPTALPRLVGHRPARVASQQRAAAIAAVTLTQHRTPDGRHIPAHSREAELWRALNGSPR